VEDFVRVLQGCAEAFNQESKDLAVFRSIVIGTIRPVVEATQTIPKPSAVPKEPSNDTCNSNSPTTRGLTSHDTRQR